MIVRTLNIPAYSDEEPGEEEKSKSANSDRNCHGGPFLRAGFYAANR